jgi:hypothetical protein
MAMEHEKDIKKYQQAAKANAGSEVGNYAASSVPVLQKHLKTALSLSKSQARPSAVAISAR